MKLFNIKMLVLLVLACIGFNETVDAQQVVSGIAIDTIGVMLDTASGIRMTIDSSVRIGVTAASAVLKGNDYVKLNGALVLQSYGQFLPNLAGQVGFGYSGGKTFLYTATPSIVTSRNFGLNYQVSTSLNLFNGLADYASLKAALLSKNSLTLSLERAKQQIAYDVTQTYLQIVLDKEIMQFALENLQYSTDREKQLQELTRVGRNAVTDLYQQQAQTSLDRLTFINAATKWRNDKVLLIQKLRMDVTTNYVFTDPVIDSLPFGGDYLDEQQMLQKALGQRPDLQSLQSYMRASKWYITRARSGYLPKLDFGYGLFGVSRHINYLNINGADIGLGQQNSFGNQLGNQVMSNLGLTLSWTIFDKLQTKYAVTVAKISADTLRIDVEDLQIQIAVDIKQAYNNYHAALQQLETSRTGLFSATQSYEALNGKYQAGAASFIELVNAQTTLLQARENKAQALINLMLQKKIIDFYTGNVNY